MLQIQTPIGKITALPSQEKEIESLTDEQFCAELNKRPANPFLFGAWLNGARNDVIAYDGWSTFSLRAK